MDAAKGSDSGAGTSAAPLKTIMAAVAKAAGAKATVVLKAGTYYTGTVNIGKEHSGLTIQNAAGEAVTVSGGVPLTVAAADWKPDPLMKGRMVADMKGKGIKEITGLRLDGQRSIRAKYPNGNMELSGNWLSGSNAGMGGGDYFKGWVPLSNHTVWVPPFRHADAEDVIANDADWPSVDWPHYVGSQSGEGDKGDFHIGVGGYCEDDLQDPLTGPTGYWCAMAPPRGQCWDKESNKGRGCTQTHMSPDGMVLDRAAHYKDPTTAVVRHCLCLVFPLPSWLRHCLCLVFPLLSWLRHCLCLAVLFRCQRRTTRYGRTRSSTGGRSPPTTAHTSTPR